MLMPCPPLCPSEPKDPCALRLCEHTQTSTASGHLPCPEFGQPELFPVIRLFPAGTRVWRGEGRWLALHTRPLGAQLRSLGCGHRGSHTAAGPRSDKRKRQAFLFSPTIHCSSL